MKKGNLNPQFLISLQVKTTTRNIANTNANLF